MKEVKSWKKTIIDILYFGSFMWLFMEFFMHYDNFSERNLWRGIGFWLIGGVIYGLGIRYLIPWVENRFGNKNQKD